MGIRNNTFESKTGESIWLNYDSKFSQTVAREFSRRLTQSLVAQQKRTKKVPLQFQGFSDDVENMNYSEFRHLHHMETFDFDDFVFGLDVESQHGTMSQQIQCRVYDSLIKTIQSHNAFLQSLFDSLTLKVLLQPKPIKNISDLNLTPRLIPAPIAPSA